MKRLMTSPLGVAALVVNAILLFLVLFAPAIWGKQAAANDILNLGAGPGLGHAFGTDALGRDILARVLVASQLSIGLALGATAIGMFIGAVIGSVAAITSSRLRWLITGSIDIMVAFPGLHLLIGRLPRLAGNQLLGLEGLELDRVGPGGDGGVDQPMGQFL